MYLRNSSGRSISLLNEPERPSSSRGSSTEAPYTPPELQHTQSYDSSPRSGPVSPSTPVAQYEYYSPAYPHHSGNYSCSAAAKPAYEEFVPHHESRQHRSFSGSARSASFDAELVPAREPPPAKSSTGKRYFCRFRESVGCEKSFTTSGHASRHSKIHTSEKGVQCIHPGCPKKFTRSDNMKQHLETHKDKPRRNSSSSSGRKAAHHRTRSSHRARAPARLDVGGNYSPVVPAAAPLVSPATSVFNLRGLNTPLMAAHPSPRAGLDALAMAAAHQNDA